MQQAVTGGGLTATVGSLGQEVSNRPRLLRGHLQRVAVRDRAAAFLPATHRAHPGSRHFFPPLRFCRLCRLLGCAWASARRIRLPHFIAQKVANLGGASEVGRCLRTPRRRRRCLWCRARRASASWVW